MPKAIDLLVAAVPKALDLRGTIADVRDHPATIKLVQDGGVKPAPFITGRIAR
ncbi:hypothetical protein [Cryobacterium serini]|uniref:hypothetical protein n=1 Tax=Cryobacterium serini TaxID=1259201 RepID=UPI003B97AFE5